MSHIWSASVSNPSSILHGLAEYSSGTLIKLFIIGRAASNSLLIRLPKTSHLKKRKTAFSCLYACQTLTTSADTLYAGFLPLADFNFITI